MFSDLVICDVHTPRVVDVTHSHHHATISVGQTTPDVGQTTSTPVVGQTTSDVGQRTISSVGQTAPSLIRPKGRYLEAIRKLYKDIFVGRAFCRVPKQRRDKGLEHRKPGNDGKLSEAALNRLRDQDHFEWVG